MRRRTRWRTAQTAAASSATQTSATPTAQPVESGSGLERDCGSSGGMSGSAVGAADGVAVGARVGVRSTTLTLVGGIDTTARSEPTEALLAAARAAKDCISAPVVEAEVIVLCRQAAGSPRPPAPGGAKSLAEAMTST